jgi:hypothetical protein
VPSGVQAELELGVGNDHALCQRDGRRFLVDGDAQVADRVASSRPIISAVRSKVMFSSCSPSGGLGGRA